MQEIQAQLQAIQRELEHAPLSSVRKLQGLEATRSLFRMVREDTVDSPAGFARLATLLEFTQDVPAVTSLLDHFPVLAGRDAYGRSTGWGAL